MNSVEKERERVLLNEICPANTVPPVMAGQIGSNMARHVHATFAHEYSRVVGKTCGFVGELLPRHESESRWLVSCCQVSAVGCAAQYFSVKTEGTEVCPAISGCAPSMCTTPCIHGSPRLH